MERKQSVVNKLVIGLMLMLGLIGIASANEEDGRNVNDILCKDVLRTSGNDRDIAMAFMHGYLMGQSGENMIHRAKLYKASDDFIEACLNDTSSKAITMLKKQIK